MKARAFHTIRALRQHQHVSTENTVLRDLPKVTGAGPFAATPKFDVIGSGSLLQATIPASSQIYARRGTIVGVSGGADAEDVRSKLSTDQPITKLARTIPILYQQISTVSPVSLLVSAKAASPQFPNSYAVIPASKDYDWIITQRKALLAWTGKASVEPYSTLKQWGNIKVSSTPDSSSDDQIALVGEGKIFQLEVAQDETIFVNPSNVIAYTKLPQSDSKRALVRLPHAATLELPVLPLSWEWPPWMQRVSVWFKTLTSKLFWRGGDVALRMSGPRTILIQTRGTQLSHVFDKHELKEIVSHK